MKTTFTLEEYKEMTVVHLAYLWFKIHGYATLPLVEYNQLWLDLGDIEVELTQSEIESRAELFLDIVADDKLKEEYKL